MPQSLTPSDIVGDAHPPYRGSCRIRARLWTLLLLPVAVGLLHFGMACYYAEPTEAFECDACGATFVRTQKLLYGLIPVHVTERWDESDCSRLLRDCGWSCRSHSRTTLAPRRRNGTIPFSDPMYLSGLGVGVGTRSTEFWGAQVCARLVLGESTEVTWSVLRKVAMRQPEDVRKYVQFLLRPVASISLWKSLRDRLSNITADPSLAGNVHGFADLLPSSVSNEVWDAASRAKALYVFEDYRTVRALPGNQFVWEWHADSRADALRLLQNPRMDPSGSGEQLVWEWMLAHDFCGERELLLCALLDFYEVEGGSTIGNLSISDDQVAGMRSAIFDLLVRVLDRGDDAVSAVVFECATHFGPNSDFPPKILWDLLSHLPARRVGQELPRLSARCGSALCFAAAPMFAIFAVPAE